jgi:uncharacterized repeat protein (TIGR01451 family)
MRRSHILHHLLSFATIISLVLSPVSTLFSPPVAHAAAVDQLARITLSNGLMLDAATTFRTTVQVTSAVQFKRVQQTGATLLYAEGIHLGRVDLTQGVPAFSAEQYPLRLTVLVTDNQLAALARLGYMPEHSDAVGSLVSGNRLERAAMDGTLSIATLGASSSVDSDGDGLTNTEEAWWCTDPNNPDSNNDGVSDFVQVQQARDWMANRRSTYSPNGPPFKGWPMDPADAGYNPQCIDHDRDSVPDAAETWVLGLNPNRESTSGDKFDDGQKLFGITHYPWGALPRAEDTAYIGANMPAWVKAPGNHPMVAAFPVPELSVVPGSWHVDRVTTITTQQGTMTQSAKTYGSTVTQGTSDSIANTVNWNNWEEVSQAVSKPLNGTVSVESVSEPTKPQDFLTRAWGAVQLVGGVGLAAGTAAACIGATAITVGGAAIPCVVAIAGAGALGGAIAGKGWSDLTSPDQVQQQQQTNYYNNTSYNNYGTSPDQIAGITANLDSGFQSLGTSIDGVSYAINQQGELLARGMHDISYAISQPRVTETHTNGHSWGGAQTTTHTEMEEHSLSESQAFTTGENWSTAYAVDSSHAANLSFSYKIKNTGTEYARELSGIIFNVYLGSDTNPIVSYPVGQTFTNVFPYPTTDIPPLTSSTIPLTLDQMRRIDLGERLTVVLANFSYGVDQLFYQNAVQGGVTIFSEGGADDASSTVDSYVLPTWGTESVQDVLARYFPTVTDADGLVNSLSTPTFSNNIPTWHEHFLSDIAWWNIYLSQSDAGNTQLRDLPAQPNTALFFRFNRDSDRDGYPDRAELQYGTDPHDPASHPTPELLAGYTSSRSGNLVTAKLALDNSGTFDAQHVSAVMYSPDDTTTIGNNTVGGNGRVRPNSHVAVGSLVKAPGLDNWGSSTAKPYSTGDYGGGSDTSYLFSVTTPGTVGQGSAAVGWNDGIGGSGTLDLGSSYHAPLPLPVSQGVLVGFDTGTIYAGASFTVTALTPRDTFTYTVNTDPYTKPVIIVGYSDPQGAHRFLTPVQVPSLGASLVPTYTGQMLKNVGLSIATTGAVVTSGLNTTNFILNSPDAASIQGAHLYVDFVSNGALVLHQPYTFTLQAGPTVYAASWATSAFSQTYDVNADNILIAHWTDSEGNIIDSAARPLNTFAADPIPAFAMANADLTWNFGTVTQGELLQHTFTLASTGFVNLSTYLGSTNGFTVTGATSQQLPPADTATYTVTLDTNAQSPGPFNRSLTLRTSDPANATRTLNVTGNIVTPAGAANAFDLANHPWDKRVLVYGNVAQYTPVDFTENIQPDTASIEPCKVFDASGTTLKGIGKYCADFGGGVGTGQLFGDGADGSLTVTANPTIINFYAAFTSSATSGATTLSVSSTSRFTANREILIHQTQGTNAGSYEFATIAGIGSNVFTLTKPISNTYSVGGNSHAQIVNVPRYTVVTVQNGAVMTALPWDGSKGGIVVFRARDSVDVQAGGKIDLKGLGFGGGIGVYQQPGYKGEGEIGPGYQGNNTDASNNGAGGGAVTDGGGAGGGNGTAGADATGRVCCGGEPISMGGHAWLNATLSLTGFGGGGGAGGGGGPSGGAGSSTGGAGGNGGGVLIIGTKNINVAGTIDASGNKGGDASTPSFAFSSAGGGGGAGGSILLRMAQGTLGTSLIVASKGLGGSKGDSWYGGYGSVGGDGRVRVEYCTNTPSGFITDPATTPAKLNCYIAEKTDASTVHFSVPDQITNGQSYVMQFGRHYTFGLGGGSTVTSTRVTSQNYANATMDALVTNIGAGGTTNLTVTIGTLPIVFTQIITQPTTINIGNFAGAVNAYIASQPPAATIDVPMRVTIDQQADVILTNLALAPVANVDLSVSSGDIAFGNGSLSAELRRGFGVARPNSAPTEGAIVPVTVTLHNTGGAASGGLTAALFATPTVGSAFYIGSAYVFGVPAGGTAQASILWNTLGFTGSVPLRVAVDPYNRVPETSESNNSAATTFNVLSRPDLLVTRITSSDPEPAANEMVSVFVAARNSGQTPTPNFALALYDGNPSSGGALIGTRTLNIAAGVEVTSTIQWTPGHTGQHQLFALADTGNSVNESDKTNNQTIQPIFVGLVSPILLDSGGASDPPYTSTLGYGYMDAGSSPSSVCGLQAYQTFRQGISSTLTYRFDNLLRGHFYHLDMTLYDCTGLGRNERVLVDGTQVLDPVDLSDQQPHRLSLRLDPAVYADNTIIVTIDETQFQQALVNEIHLYDVDYRYADAGGSNEQPYPIGMTNVLPTQHGYGYLDGTSLSIGGSSLPLLTQRIDGNDRDVFYRFDNLDPTKRYKVNLTFYHRTFSPLPALEVGVDNAYLSPTFTVPYSQSTAFTVNVPPAAYAFDGSIIVGITRTNALVGGFVNEIALEENTLPAGLVSADLTVQPSVSPGPLFAGTPLTYTFVVTNGGPDIATNVLLTATLPTTVTLGSVAATSGSCVPANPATCALGSLSSGASAHVSIVVTPTVIGPLAGFVSATSDASDPIPGNNVNVPVNALVVPANRIYLPMIER